MYTYNKNDKSYTFSSDELDIEAIINGEPEENKKAEKGETDVAGNTEDDTKNEEESHKRAKKIEVINGGNDLNISPVSDYLEIEKPKMEKKENIIVPENKN